jgi:hypothetical protein
MNFNGNIPPDMEMAIELARDGEITYCIVNGYRVKVTNPVNGASWIGTIIGRIEAPSMFLELEETGKVKTLPQCFQIEILSTREQEVLPEDFQ